MTPDLQALLDRYGPASRAGDGYQIRCPCHEDRKPSLLVGEHGDRITVECMAGCDWKDVRDALGLNGNAAPKRQHQQVYDYTDEDGRLLFQVVRGDGKRFWQQRPDNAGGWEKKVKGTRQVVYRLCDVRRAIDEGRTIYVCEGEKDADNLARLGVTATCNAGGAEKWRQSHTDCLRGAVRVVVLPDNDPSGGRHADQVQAAMREAGVPCVVIELPGLGPKGDVSDWLRRGGDLEQLQLLEPDCPREEPKPQGLLVFTDAADIPPELVEWLWYPYLPRGELVVLAGQPGTGKSSLSRWLAAMVSVGTDLERLTSTRKGFLAPPKPGRVQLVNGLEDHPSKVVVPLLQVQGADMRRVQLVSHPAGAPITTAHLEGFRQHWEANGAPDLLVIDPASSVVPSGVDGNAQSDVKASVTGPLSKLAQDFGVCVLLVAHVGKASVGGGAHPSTWVLGSTEWVAGVRSVLVALRHQHDADDEVVRVFHAKANLGPHGPAFGYAVEAQGRHARVSWRGPVDDSPADLTKPQKRERVTAADKAVDWLRDLLSGGPVDSQHAKAEAASAGLSRWALQNARETLCVKSTQQGRKWTWSLPDGNQ